MLNEIWVWWVRQIKSLIPAAWRGTGGEDAVIVRIDRLDEVPERSEGAILLRRRGAETFAAPLRFSGADFAGAANLATALRLPPGTVLRREVRLPAAAERDLVRVLGFEMDRLTPFTPDEIFWGVGGVRREAPGAIKLNLLITLRAPLENLLAALARGKLRPGYVEDAGGRIALSPGLAPRKKGFYAALYGLCAVLAVACLAVPVIRQQAALDAAQARIDALTPAAHEAMRLRQRLAIAASGQEAVAAAQASGDALQILAALTAALPDDTYITDFTLKSGELTFDGESANAARLIALLAAVPKFQNPGFAAPVTRAINGSADLFSIHLTVSP
jgi:general secretion pathway protein L